MNNATGDTRRRVLGKGNAVLWFGQTSGSRVADPADAGRVFEWLLDESRDDLGSITQYEYKAEEPIAVGSPSVAESHRALTAGAYLKRVRYGNPTPYEAEGWQFEIVFDFGEHGTVDPATEEIVVTPAEGCAWVERNDSFSRFRAGLDIRTRPLCPRVLRFHDFAELQTRVRVVDHVQTRQREQDPGLGHRTLLGRAFLRALPDFPQATSRRLSLYFFASRRMPRHER